MIRLFEPVGISGPGDLHFSENYTLEESQTWVEEAFAAEYPGSTFKWGIEDWEDSYYRMNENGDYYDQDEIVAQVFVL